jgi:hypothetical protein
VSCDDIRVQKGLALLEFRECGERVANLEKQLKDLGRNFKQFGEQIERNPLALAETMRTENLNSEEAYSLAQRLIDAHADLTQAQMKKDEFGLK